MEHRTIAISSSSILKTIFILLGLWFLYIIRDIVAIVFVAFVIASAIDPWVDWMEKRRIPRVASVSILAILLLGILSLGVVLIVPPLVEELRQLATHLPEFYGTITRLFFPGQVNDTTGFGATIQQNLETISKSLLQISSGVFGALSSVFGGLAAFLTVMVISFYMTVEEQGLRKLIKAASPAKYQPYLMQATRRIQEKMGSWFRGQLLISAIDGSITFIGLTAFHVRYALLLALLTAILRIIPYIGPVLAAIPAVIIAANDSLVRGVGVAGFFLIYNQIVDNFVVPKVMQQTVGLHPILILVIFLMGARLGGVMGTILSVPIGTIISIFVQDMFGDRRERENALEEAHT